MTISGTALTPIKDIQDPIMPTQMILSTRARAVLRAYLLQYGVLEQTEVCKHAGMVGTKIILCVLYRRYHNADYLQKSSLIVLCVLHRHYHDADDLQESCVIV